MAIDYLLTEVVDILEAEAQQCFSDHDLDPEMLKNDPDHQNSIRITALAVIEAVRQHDLKEPDHE